jgi:hypothetical protein
MPRRLVFLLLPAFGAVAPAPVAAQTVDTAKEAARIERECGLKNGTIKVTGDQIRLEPSPDEAYERVDCALERLKRAGLTKLGFVGNEMNPNALLRPALRYIATGSVEEIGALVKAAKADSWIVRKTATASNGTAIVQLESGAKMTNGEAMKLLERVWKKEFGDLEFGTAPRRLSDTGDPYE